METSLEKIRPVVSEKYEFEDRQIKKALLESSDYQHSEPRNKMPHSALEYSCARWEFSIDWRSQACKYEEKTLNPDMNEY